MFGVMGFIVGPILAALFVTILDIYSIEFRSQLEMIEGAAAGQQAEKIVVPADEHAPDGKDEESRKDTAVALLENIRSEAK